MWRYKMRHYPVEIWLTYDLAGLRLIWLYDFKYRSFNELLLEYLLHPFYNYVQYWNAIFS